MGRTIRKAKGRKVAPGRTTAAPGKRTDPIREVLSAVQALRADPGDSHARAAMARWAGPDWPRLRRAFHPLDLAGDWDKMVQVIDLLAEVVPETGPRAAQAARCLLISGRPGAAMTRIDRALARDPDHAPLMVEKAMVLRDLGRAEEAVEILEATGLIDDRDVLVHRYWATALRETGDLDGARARLRAAVERVPQAACCWYELTSVQNFKDEDALYHLLIGAAAKAPYGTRERENFDFALAKAADDRGDWARSWRHLTRGNEARKRTSRRLHDISAPFFRQVERDFDTLGRRETADEGTRPVFVIGMPRSGTTLVERIFDAHPAIEGVGERGWMRAALMPHLNDPGPWDDARWAAIAGAYLRPLRAATKDAPVGVDKAPLNFRFAGHALAAMPTARVIAMLRDPVATCLSNYRQRFKSDVLDFANDLTELGEMYRWFRWFTDFWAERFPDRVLQFAYEDLTERPEEEARRLIDFVGCDWDPACLDFHKAKGVVRTASSAQVRRKIYTGSSEKWRPYAPFLGELFDALGPYGAPYRARDAG